MQFTMHLRCGTVSMRIISLPNGRHGQPLAKTGCAPRSGAIPALLVHHIQANPATAYVKPMQEGFVEPGAA